jgi:hypothetical protein
VGRPEAKFCSVLLGVKVVDGSGCRPHDSFNFWGSDVFGSALGSQMNAEWFSILETLEANEAVDNVPHATNKREALIVVLLFKDEDASFAVSTILLCTEGNDGALDLRERESQSGFEGKAGVAMAAKFNVFETESLGVAAEVGEWRRGNVIELGWLGPFSEAEASEEAAAEPVGAGSIDSVGGVVGIAEGISVLPHLGSVRQRFFWDSQRLDSS